MASLLKEIKKPIITELKEFEDYFKNAMKSPIPLLDKITYYLVQRKGKQMRPIFVFLCSKIYGDINQSSHTAASLIELLHTASLVHDDVMDQSEKRRGFFSINALWKNKIAVIVGDYLFSKGMLIALENKEYDILQIFSKAVKEMSEAEMLQMEKARRLDIKEDIYFDIIRGKTASLISASCASGTAAVSNDEKLISNMAQFGEKLGVAFQIKDDLFDYGSSNIGKPTGIDIKEKKMTLPLIYALSNTENREKKKIINMIKRDSENVKTIRYVIDFVKDSNGLQYASQKMEDYKNEALQLLDIVPDSESKKALIQLVDFVTVRNK